MKKNPRQKPKPKPELNELGKFLFETKYPELGNKSLFESRDELARFIVERGRPSAGSCTAVAPASGIEYSSIYIQICKLISTGARRTFGVQWATYVYTAIEDKLIKPNPDFCKIILEEFKKMCPGIINSAVRESTQISAHSVDESKATQFLYELGCTDEQIKRTRDSRKLLWITNAPGSN